MLKVFFLLLFSVLLFSKTIFTQESIHLYLNEKNPYFYATVAKEYVSKENEKIYQAAFDTQFNMKYDNKRYPTTQGEYQQIDITKSIGNGMEFSLAYRNAQDTQEYNNIKTGKDGELYTSVNIPILSLINNTSQNKLNYKVAQLKTKELSQVSKRNLLSLYFISSKIYFELLLYKDIYITEENLLSKAKLNYKFISKKVHSGKLAKIVLIDVRSQIINRKQRLFSAKNQYKNLKNSFLKYLNLSEKTFDALYTLPSILTQKEKNEILYEKAQEIAIHNNPQLQQIKYQLKKTEIKSQYNAIKRYPKLNMKLHNVYDLEYEKDGYKVSLEFNFPLQRSEYSGKNETYKKETILLKNSQIVIKNNIKINIQNILQKISLKKESILLAKEEIDLLQQLENAEKRRYHEGMSSLLIVNQREILSLQAQQKLLHYHLELQLLHLQLKYELGILFKT